MKLLFFDEFKHKKTDYMIYGLSGVFIDNSSYGRLKNGFASKLKKLGWDASIEFKGRHSFSSTKGDQAISIEERLQFVEELFTLSSSSGGSYAAATVYYSIERFSLETSESEMYCSILNKIVKHLPKASKGANKNGKNNIIVFVDRNDAIKMSDIYTSVSTGLSDRGYCQIEKVVSCDSSNDTPGIIFADLSAYFLDNYLKTRSFNESNIDVIKGLLTKLEKNTLSEDDMEKLESLTISINKERTSSNLLSSLKKMRIVR